MRDDTQLVASRGGTRVFAGNLSAAVGWQQLKEHLVRASRAEGGVHTKLPSDAAGNPMGFALCDFRTAAAAETAVRMVHNTPLDGRLLFLRQARSTYYGSTYYDSSCSTRAPRWRRGAMAAARTARDQSPRSMNR